MKDIMIKICFIGIIQPWVCICLAMLWVFGVGIFEIIFFWNDSLREYFTEIRELYPLGKLFEIFPYLIHCMIGWFILGLIIPSYLSKKKRGIVDDMSNIDGDFE